jgi:hypothetical protein
MLTYRYSTGRGGMSFAFTMLCEVGQPYQSAAKAQLDALRSQGYVIETRNLEAKPWVADFAVKPKVASQSDRNANLLAALGDRLVMVSVGEPKPKGAIVAPLSVICPGHKFGLLDDGMGELARVPADAWAAAHYHATTGVSS